MVLIPTRQNAHDIAQKLQASRLVGRALVLHEQVRQRILVSGQLDLKQQVRMVLSKDLIHGARRLERSPESKGTPQRLLIVQSLKLLNCNGVSNFAPRSI
jgi:hypothetical protein